MSGEHIHDLRQESASPGAGIYFCAECGARFAGVRLRDAELPAAARRRPVAESKECGCSVTGANTTSEHIVYCPLHAAAPALVEALEAVRRVVSPGRPLSTFHDLWYVCQDPECKRTLGSVVDAALAAARGEEESDA